MIENVIEGPRALARQKASPFLQERERYLAHLAEGSYALGTIRNVAYELQVIASHLDIRRKPAITSEEVAAAADRWARSQRRRGQACGRRHPRRLFIYMAKQWLRFLGLLRESPRQQPFSDLFEDFAAWMEHERGLSPHTIGTRRWQVERFLRWYAALGRPISAVRVTDIDAYLVDLGRDAARRSVSICATSLKVFFKHAAMRGWCPAQIAGGIQGPRIFREEILPAGPTWDEVRRLLATMDTDRRSDVRDRAIVMLLAIYGLRRGEVAKLTLDAIDWDNDRMRIWRPKQRRSQDYPLVPVVGNAILRYLREVRPRSSHREVFLALKAPYTPISPTALYTVTAARMSRLGIRTAHRGPHSLRHACATRLMVEGLSLKEIADQLGHATLDATRIYAKVDMPRLREVAAFDLGGVL